MSSDAGPEGGGEAGVGGLLLNQPVVIDNGSSSIKAGFAGGSKPKVRNWIIDTFSTLHANLSRVEIGVGIITHTAHSRCLRPIGGHWNQGRAGQAHADYAWRSAGSR